MICHLDQFCKLINYICKSEGLGPGNAHPNPGQMTVVSFYVDGVKHCVAVDEERASDIDSLVELVKERAQKGKIDDDQELSRPHDGPLILESASAIEELLEALQNLMQYSDHHTGEVCTDSGLGAYAKAKSVVEKFSEGCRNGKEQCLPN